jgi:hypothetical protein
MFARRHYEVAPSTRAGVPDRPDVVEIDRVVGCRGVDTHADAGGVAGIEIEQHTVGILAAEDSEVGNGGDGDWAKDVGAGRRRWGRHHERGGGDRGGEGGGEELHRRAALAGRTPRPLALVASA